VGCGSRGQGKAARQEWPGLLENQKLSADNWHPTPFQQFIIKLNSRCNLACHYCYMYELADQSWRTRPRTMSSALVSVLAMRIADHARIHDLETVRIVFHGGEPLLGGVHSVIDALHKIREALDARVHVDARMQTNGTLLDEEALDALEARNVRVGVSLDGDHIAHDTNRRYANGHGSYDEVTEALRRLMRRPTVYSGILCVANLDADPIATYESLVRFAPPTIDLLLPHANWSSLPAGRQSSTVAPYAEWLIAIFDRWYGASLQETHIRLFDEIINLLLGGKSASEALGLTPTSLVVIETDGSIEQSDALKSAYEGAAATGLHIIRNSFDDALLLPQVIATQLGLRALCDECLACSIRGICGAGLYAHRYRADSGFRNRSVYCNDLYALIMHIRTRLINDLRTLHQSK
jgi:uncharacterized protein